MASPHLTPLAPAAREWPELVPLEEVRERPPFPAESLPTWLERYVNALAEAAQVPLDMVGMLALAMLSTAAQGRMNAVANGSTWVEPVTLYTVIAMNPGERKSTIFERLMRPLADWEEGIQELEWPLVAASQQERAELERAVDSLSVQVGKQRSAYEKLRRDSMTAPDTLRACEADLIALRDEEVEARTSLQQHQTRHKMRLIFNDLTPEACVTALSQQRGERMAVLSDEGGVFDVLTGSRYSDKVNLDVFLKGHSGNLIQVDRVGREAERINRPMLTLGLAVQPSVLADLGKIKQMNGRGLLARFLYCVPDTMVGSRRIDSTPVPTVIQEAYEANMRSVCAAFYGRTELAFVPLSDAADSIFHGYQMALEPQLKADGGELAPILEWGSKLAGAILRIAALLAAARVSGVPDEIDDADLIAALEFHDYLVAHAFRAFGDMGQVTNVRFGRSLLHSIRERGWTHFTTRELVHGVGAARQMSADELNEYLDGFEPMGYVRREITSVKPYRFRWAVNPALLENDE